MSESEFQKRVMKRLSAYGGKWYNTHGGAYAVAGVPDIIGCLYGRYVAIELKAPGKYKDPKEGLSPAQWNWINQITANGGEAIVTDDEEWLFDQLDAIKENELGLTTAV